jgi:hypothetical protein
MRIAAGLCFAACAIRLIPSVMPATALTHWSSTLPLHIAQILNGVAGPVLIAAPSRLSAVWFPPGQRATVTAVANSSLFGAAVGFYLGPGVLAGDAANMPKLLLVCLGLATAPLVAVWAYLPANPAEPQPALAAASVGVATSATAAAAATAGRTGAASASGVGTGLAFMRSLGVLLQDVPGIRVIMAVMALQTGLYDVWIGVLPQLLTYNATTAAGGTTHHHQNGSAFASLAGGGGGGGGGGTGYGHGSWDGRDFGVFGGEDGRGNGTSTGGGPAPWSAKLAGLCGMAHTFACIVGMWAVGPVADRYFEQNLKTLLVIVSTITVALFGWVITMFEATCVYLPFNPVPRSNLTVFVAISLLGFFRTAAVPVMYELAAEISFPVPEGTSAGVIVLAEHATLMTMLFVAPHIQLGVLNLICFAGLALSPLVLVLFLKRPTYHRANAEAAEKRSQSVSTN